MEEEGRRGCGCRGNIYTSTAWKGVNCGSEYPPLYPVICTPPSGLLWYDGGRLCMCVCVLFMCAMTCASMHVYTPLFSSFPGEHCGVAEQTDGCVRGVWLSRRVSTEALPYMGWREHHQNVHQHSSPSPLHNRSLSLSLPPSLTLNNSLFRPPLFPSLSAHTASTHTHTQKHAHMGKSPSIRILFLPAQQDVDELCI